MTQVIVPPVVHEESLLVDDAETREILRFFWPLSWLRIAGMPVGVEVRRLAQTLLIAAIDASHAMSYEDALFARVAHPYGRLNKLGRKLARSYVRQWWQHTTPSDLENAKIYENVRVAVADSFAGEFHTLLDEHACTIHLQPLLVAHVASRRCWV
jgi:hypothetical protein